MSQKSPENLHDLLIVKAKALYDIETQITKALPKMAEAASEPELKQAFEQHLSETETHIKRLEKVFELLNVAPAPEKSEAIRGIVDDAEWCIKNIQNPQALDAALAASAQHVEHAEMAGYGSAAEWAKAMGHGEIVDLLEANLAEEKQADEILSQLATSKLNDAANTMMEESGRAELSGGKLQPSN